jgi:ABC-type glutathione transport system ATPase component
MPQAEIKLQSEIQPSFRVAQVAGMFGLPQSKRIDFQASVSIPIEDTDWQIGLIVGPSGSGKTTIGRTMFPNAYFHTRYDWHSEKSIVDGFGAHLDCQAITGALSAVGFSSPPHWLKRFNHLSNGQQFRCELARLMLEDQPLVIVDEFTSVTGEKNR